MVTHKSSRSGKFSSSKKFDDITYQRDFESGSLAALRGKHSSDCPFRLPDRKAAWLNGFRNATYENVSNTPVINTESTHGHIINLRELLRS
ncbi:MAG: ribosome modulation factor [Colwellia sp.]|jgi:ribosome modulation factor